MVYFAIYSVIISAKNKNPIDVECKFLIPLNIRRFYPTMKRQRQIGCRELLNSANYSEFRIYITKFTYKNADRVTYFSIFLQFLLQCRVMILIALLLYWIVAIYNCHRMTIKMDSTNLLLRDSPLNNVAWIYERYLWREGSLVNFQFFFVRFIMLFFSCQLVSEVFYRWGSILSN